MFLIRFGGSPSSQSQAASQTCERTAASSTDAPDRPADSDSEEEDNKDDFDPFSSQGQTGAPPSKIYVHVAIFVQYTIVSVSVFYIFLFFILSGSDWVADFGDVNSTAPAAGTAFSPWDAPVSQPAATETEDKGWAKFTDFQPFCW